MEKTLKVLENVIGLGLLVLFFIELHKFGTTDNVVNGIWTILLLQAVLNIRSNVVKDGDKE